MLALEPPSWSVVKTLRFNAGAWVWFLVGNLSSHVAMLARPRDCCCFFFSRKMIMLLVQVTMRILRNNINVFATVPGTWRLTMKMTSSRGVLFIHTCYFLKLTSGSFFISLILIVIITNLSWQSCEIPQKLSTASGIVSSVRFCLFFPGDICQETFILLFQPACWEAILYLRIPYYKSFPPSLNVYYCFYFGGAHPLSSSW